MPTDFRRISNLLIILISIALVAFVGYKANSSSFTHDESITYLTYVQKSAWGIVSYDDPIPNNHILNTLLMKLSAYCFGVSEFSLRLPNILALVLYLVFSFKLVRNISASFYLPAFIMLIANPYLVDFFGLARGYGLSIAFMITSIYFLIKSVEETNVKNRVWFNLFAMLAVYSNFSQINFYAAALIIYNLILLLQRKDRKIDFSHLIKANSINFIFLAATILIIWEPVGKLFKTHMVDIGGNVGLVSDTIHSLVSTCLYGSIANPVLIACLSWFIVFIIIGVFIYWVVAALKSHIGSSQKLKTLIIVNGILLLILLEMELQHILLKNDFYIGRIALFLWPLIILNLILLFQLLIETSRKFAKPLAYAIAILLAINTCYNMTTKYYLEWKRDMETKQVMACLVRHHNSKADKQTIRIGLYWHFEPSVNFYRELWHLSWLEPADREDLKVTDNYYYSYKEDIEAIRPGLDSLLYISKETGACLVFNR